MEAFHTLWFSGAARVTQNLGPHQRELLDPGLREICDLGAGYSALDYLAAVDVRMDLGRRMGRFHETYDLLVTPTLPITAFEAGAEVPKGSGLGRWTGWTPFTYPFNMTQQPAASVPVGLDGDGLPVGLQIVAARHRDDLVLRAAHALYEAGWPRRLPAAPRRLGPAQTLRKLSVSPSAPARHRSLHASAMASRPSTTWPQTMPGTQPTSALISRLLRS